MAIKAVFFDLYGTLLMYGDMTTAWDDWLKSFQRNLADSGLNISQVELSHLCDGFFNRPEPSNNNSSLTVYEKRINAFCLELGMELNQNQLRKTANDTASAWQKNVYVDPEAANVLQMVRKSRKLILVSNFDHPPHVHSSVSKYSIAKYFNHIVISGDVGCKKPDPKIFQIALNKADLKAHEVIHVGDSIDDIDGARASGIRPVLIRRPGPDQYNQASDYNSNNDQNSDDEIKSDFGKDVKSISGLMQIQQILNIS
jgi:HAD superfamily hydrolase (TIGR01549 family)